MVNPYSLPRQTRETEILAGDGRSNYGPFSFKIFDVADVSVLTRSDDAANWVAASVAVSKVDNLDFDFFTVTFPQALVSPSTFCVLGSRLHERSTDLIRGGTLNSNELEKEESKQGVILQELRRDLSRSAIYPPDFTGYRYLPSPKPGASLVWGSDGQSLTNGLNPDAEALAWREALADEAAARVSYDASERTERIAADAEIHQKIDEIIPTVTNLTAQAAASAASAAASEAGANQLVQAATAGFTGWPSNAILDLGRVTETVTYFDQDWGRVTEPAV